jgi:hypothetical protein
MEIIKKLINGNLNIKNCLKNIKSKNKSINIKINNGVKYINNLLYKLID